jgi:DNA helicase-2/ATP-dependent DNA helicase PcrA
MRRESVFVLNAADGAIPSHQATGDPEQLEEERRLFYVALTRAKDWLYVLFPLEQPFARRGKFDGQTYAKLSRFISNDVASRFKRLSPMPQLSKSHYGATVDSRKIRGRIEAMWE